MNAALFAAGALAGAATFDVPASALARGLGQQIILDEITALGGLSVSL